MQKVLPGTPEQMLNATLRVLQLVQERGEDLEALEW